MKIDWVRKLTSRKFWLAVAGFVSMLMVFFNYSENEATQVASLIMAGADVIAYMLAEGLADSSGSMLGEAIEIDQLVSNDIYEDDGK